MLDFRKKREEIDFAISSQDPIVFERGVGFNYEQFKKETLTMLHIAGFVLSNSKTAARKVLFFLEYNKRRYGYEIRNIDDEPVVPNLGTYWIIADPIYIA